MFKNKTVVYVKCDGCGTEKMLGENLSFDQRMNACITNGYTFKEESGTFKNYCRTCKESQ